MASSTSATTSAFLSSSASFDVADLPSIFQLIAADGLRSAMLPAFRHALRILSQRFPNAGISLLDKYSDEIYLILDCVLQHHYLSLHAASFSENFYGLERVSAASSHLDKISLLRSLISCVVLPYLTSRLERTFQDWRAEEADGAEPGGLKRLFVLAYPYLHFAHQSVVFAHLLLYALGRCDRHHPWLRVARVRLAFLDEQRQQRLQLRHEARASGVAMKLAMAMASSLNVGMQVGAFFLQFLEWWRLSPASSAASSLSAPSVPPPPEICEPRFRSACPLCASKPRKNETLLPASGYVFCYACIVRHLRAHGNCPVTNIPTREDTLIRLFANA